MQPDTPQILSYDPATNRVYLGDGYGPDFYVLNGSSGLFEEGLSAGPGPAIGANYLSPDSFVVDGPEGRLFVGNANGNLSVYDESKLSLEGTIREPTGVYAMAIDPGSSRLFVGVNGKSRIELISTVTLATLYNISMPGGGAFRFCYDQRTNTLADVDLNGNGHLVNATTLNQVASISNVATVTASNGLAGTPVFCDPYNGDVYFGDLPRSRVTVVSGTTGAIIVNDSLAPTNNTITFITANPVSGDVYVGNTRNGFAILNGSTNRVVGNLSGPYLAGLALSTVSDRMFALDPSGGVHVYDALNNSYIGIMSLRVHLWGSAFDPNNGELYVATSNGSVSVFDPSTAPHQIDSLPAGSGPSWVTAVPSDHEVFVSDMSSNCLTVIDDRNNSILRSCLVVGSGPLGSAYDPANGFLYVAVGGADELCVVNASSLSVVTTLSLGPSGSVGPTDVAYDSRDRLVYVANYYADNVSVINASTDVQLPGPHWAAPLGGPDAVQYDPVNGYLYVGNWYAHNISVLNGTTGRSVTSIPVTAGPLAFTLDPADGLLFSADGGSNYISVIGTGSNTKEEPDFQVGSEPAGISYVPTTDQVDVSDLRTGVLSILADVPRLRFLSSSPSVTEIGLETSVTAEVDSGEPPYSFTWSGTPSLCSGAASAVLSCLPESVGNYSITVRVTDARNYSAWGTTILRVDSDPSLVGVSATPSLAETGEPVWLNVSAEGGVGGLSYAFSGLPAPCSTRNLSNLSCVPSESGTFLVKVVASDALGITVAGSVVLTVVTPPRLALWLADPSSASVGQPIQFEVLATGGIGPFTYSYLGLPNGCDSANTSEFVCVPVSPGNFSVTVVVSDGRNRTVNASTLLTVTDRPLGAAPDILGLLVSPSNVTTGEAVTVSSIVEGGVSPLRFNYTGLPPGCSSSNSPRLVCRPESSGSYTIQLTVTDEVNRSASNETSLVVRELPGPSRQPADSGYIPAWELLALAVGAGAIGAVVGASAAFWFVQRRRHADGGHTGNAGIG